MSERMDGIRLNSNTSAKRRCVCEREEMAMVGGALGFRGFAHAQPSKEVISMLFFFHWFSTGSSHTCHWLTCSRGVSPPPLFPCPECCIGLRMVVHRFSNSALTDLTTHTHSLSHTQCEHCLLIKNQI